MLRRKMTHVLAAVALAGLGLAGIAWSQNAPPANGGNARGNRGARGNFDPAQMRQQMDQRMKERLGVTDDEWKVLQPKLEKVQTLQRDGRGGMMGMMGGGRGGRGPGAAPGAATGAAQPAENAPAQSDVQKKSAELQKLLDNKDSAPDDVKKALADYRDARAKAKVELEKAQKDLKELLSVKQEAALVLLSVLE